MVWSSGGPPGASSSAQEEPLAFLPIDLPPSVHELHLEAGAGLRPGHRIKVTVPAEGMAPDAEVVVLWRGEGDWQRVLPGPGMPCVPLSALQVPGQAPSLEVVVQPEAAHQRWAVILAPKGVVADWSAPEDDILEALQRAIVEKKAAATVLGFDIQVG